MQQPTIRAFVLEGAGAFDVRTWLKDYAGVTIAERLEDADVVVFTGGSDVTPSIYGEPNVAGECDWLRDVREEEIFNYCRGANIPMFGICRGSQFLHAMMDGKLWQDVNNHCCHHDIVDLETGVTVKDTTSTHHQMVRMAWKNCLDAVDNGFTLLAVPDKSRSSSYLSADGIAYHADGALLYENPAMLSHMEFVDGIKEVEAYVYHDAAVMGIQGHPEWGSDDFAKWGAARFVNFVVDHQARNDAEEAFAK